MCTSLDPAPHLSYASLYSVERKKSLLSKIMLARWWLAVSLATAVMAEDSAISNVKVRLLFFHHRCTIGVYGGHIYPDIHLSEHIL